jgi:hypothetical protein
MSHVVLTPEQHAELDALQAELPKAELRALEALRDLGPDHKLEGEALTRFEEADHEVSDIRRRIEELTKKR